MAPGDEHEDDAIVVGKGTGVPRGIRYERGGVITEVFGGSADPAPQKTVPSSLGDAFKALLDMVKPLVVLPLEDDPTEDLRSWWLDDAAEVADATLAKMAEYGNGDLVALGQSMQRMAGREPLDPISAMQLGCLFYLLGKIERQIEAARQGRALKEDTFLDMEVYSKMARAAAAGAWPVNP